MDDQDWEQFFESNFFDARHYKPQEGQVMAKYMATAYLEDGDLKRELIDLLFKDGKAETVSRIMQVMGNAIYKDSYRVPKEMASDLLSGYTVEEVAEKPYQFTLELIFWATKDAVPKNNLHWITIPVLSWADRYTDDFFVDKND